jgi:hypothetical protein
LRRAFVIDSRCQCEVDQLGSEQFKQCMSMYYAKVQCEAAPKDVFEIRSEMFACRVGDPAFTRTCCRIAHGDTQSESGVSSNDFEPCDGC